MTPAAEQPPASRSPPPSPRANLGCPLAESPGVLLLHHCAAPKKPLSNTQALSAAAGQRRSRGRHSLRHRPPARPMRLRPARPRLGTSRDTHAIMTVWPHAGIPERSAPSCFCKETMQVWLRMCMVRVSCWQRALRLCDLQATIDCGPAPPGVAMPAATAKPGPGPPRRVLEAPAR